MEGQEFSPSCSPSAKRTRTTASGDHVTHDGRELDEEEQRALNEVELEISQLLLTGIQDVSILGNDDDCLAVWHHLQKLHSEGEAEVNDEFGIDSRLKDVIRAFAEGSCLPISCLIPELRKKISTHCDLIKGDLSDARFTTLIPVFITRKNLGEAFMSTNSTARMESDRLECLWVWETPTMDVFPRPLEERMKAARDARTLISKRYKALVKVKDAIKKGDQAAKAAANDNLSAIYKKMLLEREKRERLEAKRKAEELKAQQITNPFTKLTHRKEMKPSTSKVTSPVKPERQSKASAKPSVGPAPKPANMLLNWLKSSSSAAKVTTKTDGDATTKPVQTSLPPQTQDTTRVSLSDGTSPSETTMGEYDHMGATDAYLVELSKYIAKLPNNTNNRSTIGATMGTSEILPPGSDRDIDAFLKLCEYHRESWMQYFTYINSNRSFYVETSTNSDEAATSVTPSNEEVVKSFTVEDIINNIVDTSYGDPVLLQERYFRVFHMSDNDWKRPSMRLLVSRKSINVKSTEPTGIDTSMDYFGDSDEEWFENYDVDDVDISGSEEEEDEEDESDWIVQDNPQHCIHKHTLNLCAVVKVYCVHKNWHWIIDGVPQNNEECCSVEEAKKNGINITPPVYGYGYEGYTTNPIMDFVSGMRGNRVIMTTEDVQEFLKYCHAKHTKKELLIQQFKEMKPFCHMSEIKEKFRKYICRMKVDNTPQRWLVTTEAALLFGIRSELDAILAQAMEQVADTM